MGADRIFGTRCTWVVPAEDPGARFLVPGCYERLEDGDAECTCPTTAEELARLQQLVADLERKLADQAEYGVALTSVVSKLPGGAQILQEANGLGRQWVEQRRQVRASG